MNWIDNALGIHPKALVLRSQRTEILAANLANSDTPGFKARDINFEDVLRSAGKANLQLETTHASHTSNFNSGVGEALLYRVPNKDSIAGNTVEPEVEQAAFSENAVRYQTTLQFINGTFAGLRLAIKGQ